MHLRFSRQPRRRHRIPPPHPNLAVASHPRVAVVSASPNEIWTNPDEIVVLSHYRLRFPQTVRSAPKVAPLWCLRAKPLLKVMFPLLSPSSLMSSKSVPSTMLARSSNQYEMDNEYVEDVSSGSSKQECDEIGTNKDGNEATKNFEDEDGMAATENFEDRIDELYFLFNGYSMIKNTCLCNILLGQIPFDSRKHVCVIFCYRPDVSLMDNL
ncbi:hypothetical protein RHMOL_Rhmol10G0152600 [Rhododendron molle]|uniref:Uncharacterized protein n=1 Tax=Rhododendron molle TaxID=49168 RepID=A0ACC0M2Z8_RHOML|nr:hypothetical protein RHMOL_Rhmol10G0152600 [Rhododendron molle]